MDMKPILINKEKKGEGFFHEKLIVIPGQIITTLQTNPLTSSLYLTDIGYFPNAKNHYREREDGCEHSIFLFCVDGKGSVVLEDRIITLEKNQILMIPATVPHVYQADSNTPWSIYWLHFHGHLSYDILDWIMRKNNIIEVDSNKHSQLIHQFDKIYSLLESGYSVDALIHISSLLCVFFTTIRQQEVKNIQLDAMGVNPITHCIDYMREKVYETITLEDLMSITHLSKSYLLHIFKEQTGFSPIDYFIHIKIQRACNLLDTTNLSIKEITAQIGYGDPYYFSRIFKKIMALSPAQYRNIKKG
jgi:AraC-like DNA-binding protein/mannose-6-phosphate isomerase-like protein (cupin superfamily)